MGAPLSITLSLARRRTERRGALSKLLAIVLDREGSTVTRVVVAWRTARWRNNEAVAPIDPGADAPPFTPDKPTTQSSRRSAAFVVRLPVTAKSRHIAHPEAGTRERADRHARIRFVEHEDGLVAPESRRGSPLMRQAPARAEPCGVMGARIVGQSLRRRVRAHRSRGANLASRPFGRACGSVPRRKTRSREEGRDGGVASHSSHKIVTRSAVSAALERSRGACSSPPRGAACATDSRAGSC